MIALDADLQGLVRSLRPERTLVTTFAGGLSYFESRLLDALRAHGRPTVRILVDARQFDTCMGEVGVRFPGVRYEVFPVSASHGYRFHPKTYALLAENRASVIVASANLTLPGFRWNREIFDVLEVRRDPAGTEPPSGDLAAVAGYCDFLEALAGGAVTMAEAAASAARDMAADLRRLVGGSDLLLPPEGPWFLHSLHAPILDQVTARIDASTITHVTAYSPYFDGGSTAVRRLLKEFPAAKTVRIILDPTSTTAFNGQVLTGYAKRLQIEIATDEDDDSGRSRFLHAKLLVLRGPVGAWVVSGSANLTSAGLLGVAAPRLGSASGNVEAVVVRFCRDRAAVNALLAAVPSAPWKDWATSSFYLPEQETQLDAPALTMLDAELVRDTVRCTLMRGGLTRSEERGRVGVLLDCAAGRLAMLAEIVSSTDETLVIEAKCPDLSFVVSDEAARVSVEIGVGPLRRRSTEFWLRRPVELRKSAAIMSLHERFRPLRETSTPDAGVLFDLHADLHALLQRLTAAAPDVAAPPVATRAARGAAESTGAARGGRRIDLASLLSDEEDATPSSVTGTVSARDALLAIGSALRSHLKGPSPVGAAVDAHETGHGGAAAADAKPRVERMGVDKRPAPPPLAPDEAAQLAQLASTFAGAIRATPLTRAGLEVSLQIAEPIGTVILANDVLRSPLATAGDAESTHRAAFLDALVAWWCALLGAAPAPDGAPRGLFIRAWALDELRPILDALLIQREAEGVDGLGALASGLGVARALLLLERGPSRALEDAEVGLCVLAGQLQPMAAASWGDSTRLRAEAATGGWPAAATSAAIAGTWSAPAPAEFPFVSTLERWQRLVSSMDDSSRRLSDLTDSQWERIRRVVRRFPDMPVAHYDRARQRTSCCPDITTPRTFATEVARDWPAIASCPSCGRLIAPPEVADPASRRVADWLRAQTEGAAVSEMAES
ncbi:hypothetical protein [Gemmatimonas sp.]|uniref:hypothetical protein n=1 Tax=Gemmatimonas sp. TaxID=1962908 RepID=UPI003F6EEE14